MSFLDKIVDLRDAYRQISTKKNTEFTQQQPEQKRGYQITYSNQLMSASGKDSSGKMVKGQYQYPWFTLMPHERTELAKKCAPIFGVVTTRMNQIAGQGFKVTKDTTAFEKQIQDVRGLKSVFDEYSRYEDPKYNIAAVLIAKELMKMIPELLPDMSNFERAIIRLSRIAFRRNKMSAEAVEAWLERPSKKEDFEDVVKKYVWSLLVHGSADIYKMYEYHEMSSFHSLPGGTMFPLVNETVDNSYPEYIQMIWGKTPLFYSHKEILHDIYLPVGDNFFGLIPMEALINKILESLLSDIYWAEQADGTRPVEKIVAIDSSQGGYRLLKGGNPIPMTTDEKQRLKEAVQDAKKGAIDVITAAGNISILDVSRENMGPLQLERAREAKLDIARVFNMTNMEINNSGGEGTSGRNTADQQREIEKQKGTYPILISMQKKFQREIIDKKFGLGYTLSMMSGYEDSEILVKAKEKFESGLFGANEIRIKDLNEEPFDDQQYNYPPGRQGVDQQLNNVVQASMASWAQNQRK